MKNASSHKNRAWKNAVLNISFVLAALFLNHSLNDSGWALLLFYFILLINTFLSIRFFDRIIKKYDFRQKIIDVALVSVYGVLAFSLHSPVLFTGLACLLFIVSIIKYSLLIVPENYQPTIQRKIRINLLGTGLCIITFLTFLSNGDPKSLWAFSGLFLLGNIYFLWIKPMYSVQKS